MASAAGQQTNYGTVINCIDGDAQLPALRFFNNAWKTDWVDLITEAAPEKLLSEGTDTTAIGHLFRNILESLDGQSEKRLAIVSHATCSCCVASKDAKLEMLRKSGRYLVKQFPDVKVAGIWLDRNGRPGIIEW